MSEKLLSDISRKMNVLIALLIRNLTGDTQLGAKGKRKGIGEHARLLADMGLDARDIAEILGSPVSSIRTLLTPTRRG